MKRYFTVVAAIAMATGCVAKREGAPVTNGAQQPASVPRGDTAFASMQERGKAVMGVDQYMSAHLFEDKPDGGTISLVSSSGDTADVTAIRQHMHTIASMFSKGDFSDPTMIHMGTVPGSDVMAKNASRIKYSYSEVARGAVVSISTSDAASLAAIRKFLAFQRDAHRTHQMGDMSQTTS